MSSVALIPARPAPTRRLHAGAWLRLHLFGTPGAAFASILLALVGLPLLIALLRWGLWEAVFRADLNACHAARGACWGVVSEKFRVILFGRYPLEELWRPCVASGALLLLLIASCRRAFWKPWLPVLWLFILAVFGGLMGGGFAGLNAVGTDRWGGLPLTLLLSSVTMALAFPLGVGIALGRRSALPAIRSLCAIYVELVRGIPLVSVLFIASFLFPLLLPEGIRIDVLLRVVVGLTLFAAAYLAEVIRGGLQGVPRGQLEAAQSLGLSAWQIQRKVVLPQALVRVVPSIVNNFIATFKDSSLVTVVSLYELTGALGLALNSDADWRAYKLEATLFVALIYFGFCYAMSRYSQHLERQLQRRHDATASART